MTPRSYFQWANGSFSSVQWVGAGLLIYYLQRDNAADTTNITAFPDGFRMLTGDPFRRSYQDSLTSEAIGWNWSVAGERACVPTLTADPAPLFRSLGADVAQTRQPYLPPYNCPNGLRGEIRFPVRRLASDSRSGMRAETDTDRHSLAGTESTSTAATTSLTWRILFGTRSDVSTLRRGDAWIQLC